MSETPDQRRERRRRHGGLMMAAGIAALFVSTFTVPEAVILLARASVDGAALSGRAVAVTVVGAVTLLGGGALAIAGFNWRRSAGEGPNPEDLLLDERYGDGPVRPFDPGLGHGGRFTDDDRERDED